MTGTAHHSSVTAWVAVILLALVQVAVLAGIPALGLAGTGITWRDLALPLLHGPAPWAAVAAIAGAMVPGTVAGVALWRARAASLFVGLLAAPVLLPLLLVPHMPDNVAIVPDVVALVAGHAAMGLGFGAVCTALSLASLDGGMLRAAASCGWSPLGVFARLMLPLAIRGTAAGVLLAALLSLAASLGHLLPGVSAFTTALPRDVLLATLGGALVAAALVAGATSLLSRP